MADGFIRCFHDAVRIGPDGAAECLVCGATAADARALRTGKWRPVPPWEERHGVLYDGPIGSGHPVAGVQHGGFVVHGLRSASDLRIVSAWASAREKDDVGG